MSHRVILASAGTGKTYQLASRALSLLVAGVAPECMLASTFTRKASQEILERILQRLAEAAAGGEALVALDRSLEPEVRERVGPLERARAVSLLASLARRIDRLQMRTLDAFFVHVGMLFALDVGLPPGWQIADEHDEQLLKDQAVADVVAELDEPHLVGLLRALAQGAASRGVHRALTAVVKDAHEAWLESRPEAWAPWSFPELLSDEELTALSRVIAELPPGQKKDGSDDGRWVKPREDLLTAIADENWDAIISKGISGKVLAGEAKYYSPIPDEWGPALRPLFRHILAVVGPELNAYGAAVREVVERFQESLDRRKAAQRRYGFSDVPRALVGDAGPAFTADETHFRLDASLQHLLLDEFQDTSVLQWRVLRPLARSILEGDGEQSSFFCVGDPKQSIYQWRQGEPRLLTDLADELGAEDLDLNWRSAQVVMDAVNVVFGGIAGNGALAADEGAVRAATDFEDRFRKHKAHQPCSGQVHVACAQDEEEHWDFVARHVAELARDAPGHRIGVLLRGNRPIPGLIRALRDQGVRGSGEGGNPLTDAASVQRALSLVHLADHPGDSAAFHHVTDGDAAAWGVVEGGAGRLSRRVRARLLREGYGPTLVSVQEALTEDGDDWERRRYGQLVDLAFRWDERATLRPSDFEARIRQLKVEDPTGAQVQVMTVHGAKGLEFDAVVLPELDGTLAGSSRGLFTARPVAEEPLTTIFPSYSVEVSRLDERLGELYVEQRRLNIREELCVLYVAMTRARRRLDMLVSRPGKTLGFHHAGILRAALGFDGPAEDGVLWRAPGNGDDWRDADLLAAAATPEVPAGAAPQDGPPALPPGRSRSLRRRSPSSLEHGRALRAGDLLGGVGRDGRRRGTLVHRWLEEVEWVDDGLPAVEHLLTVGGHGGDECSEDDRADLAQRLLTWLEQPAMREVLTRPRVEADLEVWRERRFALPDEQDGRTVLLTGSFDRVVLTRRDGRIVEADLIDFKTDAVHGADLEERVEVYRPQMEEYRRVLTRLTGLAPERISARLVFLAADQVRTL